MQLPSIIVFLVILNIFLESRSFFAAAVVCSGVNYDVPDSLSAINMNVAAASSGATCTSTVAPASCTKVIDGLIPPADDFQVVGGVGMFIQITFVRQFTVNTLRIMQRGKTTEQNKKIALTFSGGETFKETLKRNMGSSQTSPAMWEVKSFPEVRASWVNITVESVYSTGNNGYKEIEIFNRYANKGKCCDTLVLAAGVSSEQRALFGRTVSFILQSAGAKIVLHPKEDSPAKKYTFGLGISGNCTLNRFDGSDTEVSNTVCDNAVTASGFRSFWIDFRSANIVLGAGTTVIFQFLDSSPFEVGYISFTATTATTVTLCNRENKCYQDADHYWPLDKVSGEEFHDLNGGRNAKTIIENADLVPTFNAFEMFANAPKIDTTVTPPKYVILGNFMGDCIGDVESCVNGMTLSFRVVIPSSLSTVTRLLGTTIPGKTGFFVNSDGSTMDFIFVQRLKTFKISLNIVKEKQYHFALVWTKRKTMKVLANGVEFQNVKQTEQVISVISTILNIGRTDIEKGTFRISDVAIWKRELSSEEINEKLSCSQVGIVDESCSPAVNVASVGPSYTADQCASIASCHDGSTCHRRDGLGTQATISTSGSVYTASSIESEHTPAVNGKITSVEATLVNYGWSPSPLDKAPYLQIDTRQFRAITAVVVQGTGASSNVSYITKFAVSKSQNCKIFQYIMDGSSKRIFTGNTDSTALVSVAMAGLETRCLRIEPTSFVGKNALKVKLLGTRQAKNFHGCYRNGDFATAENYDSLSITPEKCITACGLASKAFAALKYGKYCLCGTSATTAVADSFCNTPCSGTYALACGGDDAYSVYSITGSFPTTFVCTAPANVTSLTTFSTSCTANSLVECDFGESLPVRATNTALNNSYYSVPSVKNVWCKGYLDISGESDEKRYGKSIEVYDDFEATFHCLNVAATFETHNCDVRITKGTTLKISYQLLGQPAVTMELCDAVGMALGKVFETPVGGSQELTNNITIVLLDTRMPDDGQFLGIEVNVERDGFVSIQRLRPVCGSGSYKLYQYADGRIETQNTACSFATNCADGQTFSTDSVHCAVNGSVNATTTAQLEPHEVVSVNHFCFTSIGRHRIYFENVNVSDVAMGDRFALYFPSIGSAKLSRKDPNAGHGERSTVVIYSGQNNGIGSILGLAGNVVKNEEYSISFIIKIGCVFRLPLTYTAIGVFTEKVTIKSEQRTQEYSAVIVAQEKIVNVSYIFLDGAIVNEPYNYTINAHNGSNISYAMRFDNTTLFQGSKPAALEAYSFFKTYTTKGMRNISIILENEVSQVLRLCEIKVMEKVAGLNLTSSIPPQAYPTVTSICFKLTNGEEVTITADFGNGVSVANGTFDIEDVFVGCFNHSYSVGAYPMTIKASNQASEQMLSQLIIVEAEIVGLSFVVGHASRDIEVNESICVVINMTQGTAPKYLLDWGDGKFIESLDTRLCHQYSIYDKYTINVTAFNNVSKQNVSKEIQVHKPVYDLINFVLVCPPTNFSNPTPCVLTIKGGNDFVCTWVFGDGTTGSSNPSHVGKPFNHLYAATGYYDITINCINRLYNVTNQTLAIVEKAMLNLTIDQIPNCPHGQSATVYVRIIQGTGVEFTTKKRNYHTGSSVDMIPVFNPERTNSSMTFQCEAIGVYCIEATAVNNVTTSQYYQMCFKIDYTMVSVTVTRLTDEYVMPGDVSRIEIKMSQGSNVTCYLDFKDGLQESTRFFPGNYPSGGGIVLHTYAGEGDYYIRTVCNNSVSNVTFTSMIKSQHPAKDVFLVCGERQPFPPGQTQCTIDKPANIPTPTNFTCITKFGDGNQTTNLMVSPLDLSNTYSSVGAYVIDTVCENKVSSVNLTSSVEIQTPIDNDGMLLTTSGGIYLSGSGGKGKDFSYFPTKSNISLDLDWGNGTNVSVSIDWGDNTHSLIQNNSILHLYPLPGTYAVKITMYNAVSYKNKTYVLNLQEPLEGFTFRNNGPVSLGKQFEFDLAADQVGTATCFSLNVGNGTTYLYKPPFLARCEPECSSGSTSYTYVNSDIPMIVTHIHFHIGNYRVIAVGCNIVSRVTFTDLANLSPKPCKYPVVNFTSTEVNLTMETAIPYFRSSRIPVTPVVKINCSATKLATKRWTILKCNEMTGNCTKYSPNCTNDMPLSEPILVIPKRCLDYAIYMIMYKIEMVGGGTSGIAEESRGFIRVIKSSLFVKISGGTSKSVGYGKTIPVDGMGSIDPDTGDNVGMKLYWFCGEISENLTILGNSTNLPGQPLSLHQDLKSALNRTGGAPSHLYKGCLGHGQGRLDLVGGQIMVPSNGMKINHTYVVTLLVVKDTRWGLATQSFEVLDGNPPDCKIRCVTGCGQRIIPSDKHALRVDCTCPECGTLSYQWQIKMKDKITNQMALLNNAQEMLSSPLNYNNIVVKPNMLKGGTEYQFRIIAYDRSQNVQGFAERAGFTNSPPGRGTCDVQPKIGDNETPFNVSCWGWLDTEDEITFSVYLYDPDINALTPLLGMTSKPNEMAALVYKYSKFPVGKKEMGFVQKLKIKSCDPFLSCSSLDLNVMVKLKEQSEGKFQEFLNGIISTDGMINILFGEGKIDELCTYMLGEMTTLKELQATPALAEVSETTKSLVQKTMEFCMNSICKITSSDSKKASRKAAVINLLLELKTTFTSAVLKQSSDGLIEATNDISNFLPSELSNAAPGLFSSLGKSMEINAGGSSDSSTSTSPTPEPQYDEYGSLISIAKPKPKTEAELAKEKEEAKKQSLQLAKSIDNIGNAIAVGLAPGDAVNIETPMLVISIAVQEAAKLTVFISSKGAIGGLQGALPSTDSQEALTLGLAIFLKNPYSWADGFSDVSGGLMSFKVGNEDGSNKVIQDTPEPIEIDIKQTGQILNMTTHHLSHKQCSYHVLEIPKNHSSIFVEAVPLDPNMTVVLYLKRGDRPTKNRHDFNYTVTSNVTMNETQVNATKTGKSPNMMFLSNDELNKTSAGTWKLALCAESHALPVDIDAVLLSYNISMFTAACMFLNETTGSFSNAGMKVGSGTTRFVTKCSTTHATSFAGDFFVPPNSIDWSKISLDELLNNPIVFIIVMVIFGLYFLLLIWARRADKKDLEQIGLTPLPDNDPRDNYLYEIVVYTGHAKGSGTTSEVFMILTGGLDETSPRQLRDPEPSRVKFLRGGTDYFLLAVPHSLGKLKQLRIWHNNNGSDPSWFLQRVMVRDLQADSKTWFVNLRWLAVEEDDGQIDRVLQTATKEELTSFNLLFSTEARKNLTDNHLWFSVVARPAKSTFTRVQRLSCCLSVILTTMVANAMFYQVGDESSTGTSIHIGPFSFSVAQISIGITSSLVVLPVNIIIVTIFRKLRPPDPKKKDEKENDPNQNGEKYIPDDEQLVISEDLDDDEQEHENEDENDDEGEDVKNKKSKGEKKKPKKLSPKFAYLAYTLVFLASTVSGTFTVFYGLTFGKKKSEGWISSMMISFWQDVLISQPLKVFAAAMFFALVIKDPNKGEEEEPDQNGNDLTQDEELVHKTVQNSEDEKALRKLGFVDKPPDPEKLEASRQLRLKQKEMMSIIYELVQYLFFLIIVLIIAYGNRDPMAYGVTRAMEVSFVDSDYTGMAGFDSSSSPAPYWNWVTQSYLATLKPQYWYGPVVRFNKSDIKNEDIQKQRKIIKLKHSKTRSKWKTVKGNYIENPSVVFQYKKNFVADHETAYLVGSPRLRQLRVQKDKCTMLPFVKQMFSECNADYEWENEDKDSYHKAWKPFGVNDTEIPTNKSPWYYRSAWELKGTPYWGHFASYWGGGYVADFGNKRTQAEKMAASLSSQGWIDKYTRAIFAEFTIYNAYTNFFSAVTLLTEVRATGGYHHMPKIQTLRLYRYIGPEMAFVMACEVTYIAFLLYFLYKQVKKYRAERKEYFKDAWNYLEIFVLAFSISSVGLYFARLGMTSYTIKNMKETPDSFVSFQYVAFLDEWVSACCSMAVFFSFLKFLRLLRFNRRMALLTQTLKQAAKPLFFFFIYFGFIFLSYAQFGFAVFGVSDDNYSSFHRTIVTLFGMTLGDFDFPALLQANRIFGPLYFFSYVVLILFILMNVFLSIIVDTFNEVNRDVLKQANDHEMLSFMMHTVKANIGKQVGPAIKPTYKKEKSKLEKDTDDIEEISDNIEYAFRNMCMEDIRQVKWFETKNLTKKKKLVLLMILEADELYSENDICDAIPVFDEYIANHSEEDIIQAITVYRGQRKQQEIEEDEVSRMSNSSEEETESDSNTNGGDEYAETVANGIPAINVTGTHRSRRKSHIILHTRKRSSSSSGAGMFNLGIGSRSSSSTDLYPGSNT